ncbi:uncharacterized protein DMENIID0001_129180 [Sergentomyia squamirostris]
MMKRFSNEESDFNLMKRVNLVERNPTPCGLPLVNVNRVGKHDSSDIVALAREIENADKALKNRATGKLSLILDQIRFLQQQAAQIIKETEDSQNLHEAACNFQKVPGKIYHLFRRESGQKYLSMLSPEEWGNSQIHEFLGSFRLEYDQSWTPLDHVEDVNAKILWSERLLAHGSDSLLQIESGQKN